MQIWSLVYPKIFRFLCCFRLYFAGHIMEFISAAVIPGGDFRPPNNALHVSHGDNVLHSRYYVVPTFEFNYVIMH
jgi:hypothetical protein